MGENEFSEVEKGIRRALMRYTNSSTSVEIPSMKIRPGYLQRLVSDSPRSSQPDSPWLRDPPELQLPSPADDILPLPRGKKMVTPQHHLLYPQLWNCTLVAG